MGALFGQNKSTPDQGPKGGVLGLDTHLWGESTAARPRVIGEYTAPVDERGFMAKALDFAVGAGDTLSKPYRTVAKALPYARGMENPMNRVITEGYDALDKAQARAHESFKAGRMNKASYDDTIRSINKAREELFKKAQENLANVEDATNPRKVAAAGVNIAADLATGGSFSAASKTAKAGGNVARKVLFGTGTGAVSGAANALQEDDPTLGSVVQGAVIGGTIGAAIPTAGAAGKQAKKALTPAVQSTADALTPYVSKADQIARAGIDKVKGAATKVISALPGGEEALARGAALRTNLKKTLVDSQAAILDRVRRLEKSGNVKAGTADALYLKRSLTQGNRMANEFIDNNEKMVTLHSAIGAVDKNSKRALDAVGEYSAALRDLDLARASRKDFSQKRVAALESTVKRLEAKYGTDVLKQADTALKEANKELTALLKGTGLSEKEFDDLIANDPNYIRTQRKQSKWALKMKEQRGAGAGAGTKPIQKLNAKATQEQINPIYALHERVQQIHQWKATNDLKQSIAKIFVESGEAKLERSTANVTRRQAAKQFLSETKEGKKIAAKMVRKNARELRIIQSELNKLNKAGLDESLKKTASNVDAPILTGKREKINNPNRATNPMRDIPKLSGTAQTDLFSRSMTAKETRDMVGNLIAEDTKKLRSIRNKIANRDPKAAALIDELTDAKAELEAFNMARKEAWQDMMDAKDGITKGKPTITFFEDGVKNVVAFHPDDTDIVTALRGMDKQQMNAIMNTSRVLNNIFKYGTTQGNPAFAIPNFFRDQLFSGLNSESIWRTHNPFQVAQGIVYGIMDGLGIPVKNELWNETKAIIQGSRRIDINSNLRRAANEVAGNVKGTRSIPKKVVDVQLGNDTKKFFRKVNDLISGLETATRFQNYAGTKKLYAAKGAADEVASGRAALAALRNSVDFSASGDLGKVMNTLVPYFNASIQGPRTLLRSFSERPATTSMKFATAAAPVVYIVNYNLADPNRAKIYADTPEYVRANNLMFISGNQRFLIPIPKDVAGLWSPIRRSLEAQYGYDAPTFMTTAKDLIGALTPIQTSSPMAALSSVVPGPLKAGLELGTNTNFYTGREIVPEYIKNENLKPEDQYYRDKDGKPIGVSGTAIDLAKKLGVSPMQLEYYQKALFGELGGPIAMNALDQVSGQETVGGRSVGSAIKRRFVYSGTGQLKNDFRNVYSPLRTTSDAKEKEIMRYIGGGEYGKAQRKAQEFNEYVDQRIAFYKDLPFYDEENVKRLEDLKIDIQIGKKTNKPYVKR